MIKYSIRGENLEVTEAIRDYVVSKLEKIEKYFQAEQELDARVNLKVYREKTAKVGDDSAWLNYSSCRRCVSKICMVQLTL